MEIDNINIRDEKISDLVEKCNNYLSWLEKKAEIRKSIMSEQGIENPKHINWYAVEDIDAASVEGMGDGYAVNKLAEGCKPVLRLAHRYGNIPECGDSYNFRDQFRENGVSTVGSVCDTAKKSEYYDSFFGTAEYNVVIGWDFGAKGSDGEMLLTGAFVVCADKDFDSFKK